MRPAILFLASGGFVGYIPFASGTFGTLVAIPLFIIFAPLAAHPMPYLAIYVLAVALACFVAGRADLLLAEQDSSKIVIDEIVGYLAATLFLEPTWTTIALTFFIFRLFDVIKPFPASYVDREVHGGTGVVLDDVVSGLYANVATRLILWVL